MTSRELDALIKRATTGQRLSGLRVSLVEPEAVPVVDMPLDAAVSRWIDEQRQKRLHSLLEHQHAQTALRQTNQLSANSGRPALRTRDVQELEHRQGAGETLTDDELTSLEEAHAVTGQVLSGCQGFPVVSMVRVHRGHEQRARPAAPPGATANTTRTGHGG